MRHLLKIVLLNKDAHRKKQNERKTRINKVSI